LVPQQCTVLGVEQNLRTPYVATYNLGIQRAITNNLSLEASYVGNHATKLLGLSDLNRPLNVGGFSPGWGNPAVASSPAGQCLASASKGYNNCGYGPDSVGGGPSSAAETAARPFNALFPYLSYIYWLNNSNVSNYNGLQVSATQRTQHGVSFVLGYTWAHALAESADNWSFRLPVSGNQKSLYSSTAFDIRHRFTASVTYAIPGVKTPGQILQGWSLNSIVTLQTGNPWGINDTSTDFSGTNEMLAQNSVGEQWNFYGNPSDFQTTKALNGTAGLPVLDPEARVVPVRHGDDLLGAISLSKPPSEPLTSTEDGLLRHLASQASLVMRNAQLTAELRATIEELLASRRRLVEAQDAERRRIERNLHDGAQQQLIALAIQLGLLAESAGDPDYIRQAVPDLKAQLSTALDDLRALARGIYPPLLAEQGLVMALRTQAARSPVPVVLEADQVGRYSQDAESTVYFCTLEALQNVAKHARASAATVRLSGSAGTLEFSVSDDGAGFPAAATRHGSGLQGMSDRLAAHGGTLTVTSQPGQGTTITGRLPTSERTAAAGFPAASPG
jgi:signal transduction histidine kinase